MNKNLYPSISNRQQLLNASLLLVHFKLKKKEEFQERPCRHRLFTPANVKAFMAIG